MEKERIPKPRDRIPMLRHPCGSDRRRRPSAPGLAACVSSLRQRIKFWGAMRPLDMSARVWARAHGSAAPGPDQGAAFTTFPRNGAMVVDERDGWPTCCNEAVKWVHPLTCAASGNADTAVVRTLVRLLATTRPGRGALTCALQAARGKTHAGLGRSRLLWTRAIASGVRKNSSSNASTLPRGRK